MIQLLPLVAAATVSLATPSPSDVSNIDLSMKIVARVGDEQWPGWSQTPFVIELLTDNGPALINSAHPEPVPSFPPNFEAAFWVNGVPTIVIGEPQFTQAHTPIRWSVTLLHEHFHQWQDSWPQYQAALKRLNLAPPGDTAGMWMLNYPFPYTQETVDRAYAVMSKALADALNARGSVDFSRRASSYLRDRQAFAGLLKADDYRYFAFQCWQEGVARYTEFAVAHLAAATHAEDPTFLSDQQSSALAADSQTTYAGIMRRLEEGDLAKEQRTDFYALGAGEALLLDDMHPGWRLHYLDPRMDLGIFFS